ncbi:hypothetical protein VTN31DRAFT_6324 [Thermomyces dupontii]|uniref:uncharacterized protein n=1 Tax=Talaromyces thermophilus TaxID=28565 RepID=UPI0037433549
MSFPRKVLEHFRLRSGSRQQASSQAYSPSQGIVHDDERMLSISGTYPRLARLHDGSILAGYTRREGNLRILEISKSHDSGQTFAKIGEVTRSHGDTDNLFLLEVAPGTVLAAFRNHDLGPGGYTYFRITVCRSQDGGRSWHYLSQAAEKRAPLGLWEPFMRMGQEGEVQMTFSQEFAHDDQRTMMVVSYDQGTSWTKPRCIEGANNRLRDGMTGIAETFDQILRKPVLVMVFETTRYGPFNIEAVLSYDDGKTWGYRQEVYNPPRGHNAGAPQICSFGDGSMAVAFMTDDQSRQVRWYQNAAIRVVFSTAPVNGQLQWSKPAQVSPASSFWPGILTLDHRTALATYDRNGPKAKSLSWPGP